MTNDDWMHFTIEVPARDGMELLAALQAQFGFVEVDWCELQRADRARVSYGPCPPRTESGFTIDPFPPA